MRILQEYKLQQASDLEDLRKSRERLKDVAGHLAEKYEDAKDTHEKIVQRLVRLRFLTRFAACDYGLRLRFAACG